MYRKYIKRLLDFVLSFLAIAVLSPLFLVLTAVTAAAMHGNPFFVQKRPGKDEKIFKLIKFRTMTCKTDENGELLPDDKRLTAYGKALRSTSLDELPELINILKGDMAIIGPRPLLIEYLPLYNEKQSRRHEVRPGLSGLAQVNGRNAITWEQRFDEDVEYVDTCTFGLDVKLVFLTIYKVLKREGISGNGVATMTAFTGNAAEAQTATAETAAVASARE